ncbi:alpha/beta fold hydrolase [Falsirhodobacter sp. 1013]|uniref:alpha/beta fold hydrolase n=1 Tax=Falsirhodobacter sp. 1013 TaxID=3417566 RepID=UPI003EB83508
MFNISRRFLMMGLGAVALSASLPAMARQVAMPAVRMIRTNGIDLAVYEAGSGPAVVLLHGFPGLAYTWRHQIPALVAAGYRVIAPDLRGYGLSDRPEPLEAYDLAHLTGDIVGMLDELGIEQAIFVGHDWGGLLSWQLPLFHLQRVRGVVSFNTPHIPHWMLWLHPALVDPVLPEGHNFVADPRKDPIAQMREVFSPDMYVLMFQNGHAADDIMNTDPRAALRGALRKDLGGPEGWPDLPMVIKNMEYYGQPAPAQLPGQDVLTADELDFYVRHYERTGFTPANNWYRNISRNWEAGLNVDQAIHVPSLMISAANDVVLQAAMTDGMEAYVPDLEKHVVKDCWHWTPEEKPEESNALLLSWLNRRFPA